MNGSELRPNVTVARAVVLRALGGVALLCAMAWAPNAQAYKSYDNLSGNPNGCMQCHSEFGGGPSNPLHDFHTDSLGITECNLCHPSGAGSKPVLTYWSGGGAGAGLGCAGCHGGDYGETSPNSLELKASAYGLRRLHTGKGVTCEGTCHRAGNLGHSNPLPEILPENVAPPYYGLSNNNLQNPCAGRDEDTAYDEDRLGLDNDGDGAADWPADSDCPACGSSPAAQCVASDNGMLIVSEQPSGKAKLKASLKKLAPAVPLEQFGDPVAGSTAYAVCIYDQDEALRGEIAVVRAGASCGSPAKPCWETISDKGYKYGDKSTSANGIAKIVAAGGDSGKGKVVAEGKNSPSMGQTSLPTGIAAALESNTEATVQVVTSDAGCFGVTVSDVKKADGVTFSATGP